MFLLFNWSKKKKMSLQTERRFIEQEDQQPCALLNTPCNRLFSKLQDSNHKNQ